MHRISQFRLERKKKKQFSYNDLAFCVPEIEVSGRDEERKEPFSQQIYLRKRKEKIEMRLQKLLVHKICHVMVGNSTQNNYAHTMHDYLNNNVLDNFHAVTCSLDIFFNILLVLQRETMLEPHFLKKSPGLTPNESQPQT